MTRPARLPANRLDCPRCRLEDLLDYGAICPRLPIWPTVRVRTFRGHVQVEMCCGQCSGTWWSRHYQALVMHDFSFGGELSAI